jgi:hypothetical protein
MTVIDINGFDFLRWQRDPSVGSLADWEANYGVVVPLVATSAAVPEPASMLLMMTATQVLFLRVVQRGLRSQQLDDS